MSLRRTAVVALLAAVLAAAGCARAADESRVEEDLQTKLTRDLPPGLFELVGVRREGSAPLPAGDSGAERVIVYFNATLRLARDYTFGQWDQLAPSSVAYVLGATEKGVVGLQPQNRAGDIVRAYGSAIYEQGPDGWVVVAETVPARTAAAPDLEGSGPPSRSKALIDKLAAMVNLPPPGVSPQQDEIIADELARAAENIDRRVQRRQHTFTLATGPEGGAYARYGESLIAAVNSASPSTRLRQRRSDGSVANALLLSRGEADYAIVQGDVAAAAFAGEGVFADTAKLDGLRAVGALFPEAVHVVVLADSRLKDIGELRGMRVDIGAPASGTRFDAVAVLEAHGLTGDDLAEARQDGTTAAIARLRRRQLDAVFVTSAAPIDSLQRLATAPGMRLLPINEQAMERLVQLRPGLSPLTLPANTYPRQSAPVFTVAAAALLVTTVDAPDEEVARVADLVFRRMPAGEYATNADAVRVSAQNERRGVTIPLHSGVTRRETRGTAGP
jgi:TRAP transporter TAXI family solute receptor